MCRFIVNLSEILDNLKNIKNSIPKATKVCAVVKANAYGFGMRKICFLLKSSVDYFAVARLGEFLKFKSYEINKPCLILSPLDAKDSSIAIKNNAEITISSDSDIDFINKMAVKYNTTAKVHIKIDTGMNRFGLKSKEQFCYILDKIKCLPNVELVGVYTHLAEGTNTDSNLKQSNLFDEYVEITKSYGFNPIFHFSNSYGYKCYDKVYDMVRVGFSLYGEKDISEHRFVSVIKEVKHIKKGETIGYNRLFEAQNDMTIAVCEGGYADGVNFLWNLNGRVLINGEYARIVGRICMDSFMVDITNIKSANINSSVLIFGKSKEKYISPCDIASSCGTITLNIYTSISNRVKREYEWRNYASYNRKIQRKKT